MWQDVDFLMTQMKCSILVIRGKVLFLTKKILIFFLFLHENVFLFLHENMLWYSFEAPHRDSSNEYPQHMLVLHMSTQNICFCGEIEKYLHDTLSH